MSEATNEYPAKGYAATATDSGVGPFEFTRRGLREDDVLIDISHCGICHSDLHQARNDWGGTHYPIVPGHEIVGHVAAVGDGVKKYQAGDRVAIGCMVDSCLECKHCEQGLSRTYGGYSDKIVCREEFVLSVPDGLDMARTAPLLCAGITTYSPLRNWKVGPGSKVAVAGLGGLGHMGVKIAAAMGAEVTVLTRSESKRADAEALGAADVLLTTDRDAMKAATGRFDLVLDTIPVRHELPPYLHLLRVDGALVLVGMIEMMPEMHSGLLLGRKIVTGSGIGGIAETQEMLDFCANKNILSDIELIRIQDVNMAYERMEESDVKYRFVIDMESLSD
jgi:uncharacterized zinc-type alcohol dehydrogenase-like protein